MTFILTRIILTIYPRLTTLKVQHFGNFLNSRFPNLRTLQISYYISVECALGMPLKISVLMYGFFSREPLKHGIPNGILCARSGYAVLR